MNTNQQNLFNKEEFVLSLFELETAEEVQEAVRAEGVELSLEEISMIRAQLMSRVGTLSADALENVAGGASYGKRTASIIAIIDNVFSNVKSLGDQVDTWTVGRW